MFFCPTCNNHACPVGTEFPYCGGGCKRKVAKVHIKGFKIAHKSVKVVSVVHYDHIGV